MCSFERDWFFIINIATAPAIIKTATTATVMEMQTATADSVVMLQVVVVVLHRVVVPPVVVGAAVVTTVECDDSVVRLRSRFRGGVRFRVRQRVKL